MDAQKGMESWKGKIKKAIERAAAQSTTWDQFKTQMRDAYGIVTVESPKNVLFTDSNSNSK